MLNGGAASVAVRVSSLGRPPSAAARTTAICTGLSGLRPREITLQVDRIPHGGAIDAADDIAGAESLAGTGILGLGGGGRRSRADDVHAAALAVSGVLEGQVAQIPAVLFQIQKAKLALAGPLDHLDSFDGRTGVLQRDHQPVRAVGSHRTQA